MSENRDLLDCPRISAVAMFTDVSVLTLHSTLIKLQDGD
jgi:hypothetical protein